MGLEVQPALEAAFQEADKPESQPLDEFLLRDRLSGSFRISQSPTLSSARATSPSRRSLGFPAPAALWLPGPGRCTGSRCPPGPNTAGVDHHWPDVALADDEVIDEWSRRAGTVRHPLLRARYADLAWEITRFRRSELTRRADVRMAHAAVDGYLDAVERKLTAGGPLRLGLHRAGARARSLDGTPRTRGRRGKAVLFWFQADCEARGPPYMFWRLLRDCVEPGASTRAVRCRQGRDRRGARAPACFALHTSTTARCSIRTCRARPWRISLPGGGISPGHGPGASSISRRRHSV